jgi:hypothetical protein
MDAWPPDACVCRHSGLDLQLALHRRGDVNESHQIAQLFTTQRMLNDLVD